MGLVGRIRSLLCPLSGVRFSRQLVLGLGPVLLVWPGSLLRLRLSPGLPASLSALLLATAVLLVLGRLAALAHGVGRATHALQVAPAARIRSAQQIRSEPALAQAWPDPPGIPDPQHPDARIAKNRAGGAGPGNPRADAGAARAARASP